MGTLLHQKEEKSYCEQNLFRRPVKREGHVYETVFPEGTRVAPGWQRGNHRVEVTTKKKLRQAGKRINLSVFPNNLQIR